jgi:hypothetical protein
VSPSTYPPPHKTHPHTPIHTQNKSQTNPHPNQHKLSNNQQDKLKTLCKPTVHEFMFYTNAAGVAVCSVLVLATGAWGVFWFLGVFCVCGVAFCQAHTLTYIPHPPTHSPHLPPPTQSINNITTTPLFPPPPQNKNAPTHIRAIHGRRRLLPSAPGHALAAWVVLPHLRFGPELHLPDHQGEVQKRGKGKIRVGKDGGEGGREGGREPFSLIT